MKKINQYRFIIYLFIIAVSLTGNAHSVLAYNSAYTNYEISHDIRDETASTHTFSFVKNNPGNTFKLFIPPGTIYISVMLYATRDALVGAAARLNTNPTCDYNEDLSETQYGLQRLVQHRYVQRPGIALRIRTGRGRVLRSRLVEGVRPPRQPCTKSCSDRAL